MLQQILAFAIILYFVLKLVGQKRNKSINNYEFLLWLVFWLSAGTAVIFIKQIDKVVARLGFSGSGIDVLIYLSMAILFYLVFRLRIRMEKQERNITKIIRNLSIDNKN